MKKINIAICGFGIVGSGTYALLKKNRELLINRTGLDIEIKKILVADMEKDRDFPEAKSLFTDKPENIYLDKDIDIVVEVMGGIQSAESIIINSLKKKKSVVTANKALLALKGFDIVREAEKNSVDILFEASVAGGIPIIRIVKDFLLSNNIEYLYGILNGTSNYILTEMTQKKLKFDTALKEAQDKGYAEKDPTFDIEGIDTAHKLAILLNLIYDIKVDFNQIYTEGITGITDEDIKFADEFGYSIKLLAVAKRSDGYIEGRVHPALVKKDSILSNINNVYNAIYVKGDFLGSSLYYGRGAGSSPTATSVVADIVEAAINIDKGCLSRKSGYTALSKNLKKLKLASIDRLSSRYYMRFSVADAPGVLSKISGILSRLNISIESVIQKGKSTSENSNLSVSIVMITHESLGYNIKKAVQQIDNLDITHSKTFIIRIEDFYA